MDAEAESLPVYYMIDCAHPTHFERVVSGDGAWRDRIRGLRPNASTLSHAELDEAPELDEGDPRNPGARCTAMRDRLPQLTVLGGAAARITATWR